ncbi:hypothetical protein RJ640_004651 [Escallonia rubra]|uniref:Uncharacterized protein n=1 Tax=Escallonia rubra TaxID=112253 RepID=A0AA88UJX1_9ASTE|nr:hypothetical protein RJ640_004651 [Escallonia rubra]
MAPRRRRLEDMISSMPDSVLFIIVSLLPFKEAAQTSILSKRWRFIWQATRNIEFDERHFVKQDEGSEENKENQRRDFIRFARLWIETYEEPVIHKFRLAFSNPANHALDMQVCIGFAVARQVKVLDLDFSVPSWNEMSLEDHQAALFDLPLLVYEDYAENLESLKLFSCNFLVTKFKNFRALKNLSLGWIERFRSIVEAVLDFGLEFEFSDCGQILYDFLVGVCYIKALTICSYILQVIPTAEECLSESLPEVELLTLKTALDAKEFYGITFFLNSCPRLETLSIDLTAHSRIFEGYNIDLPLDYHDFVMSKPFVVYPCVRSTLKVVEVKGFKGGKNELVALQYFIRYGSVLEKMAISVSKEEGPAGVFSLGLEYRQKAMQLLQLEPASPRLAIENEIAR